MSSLVALRFLDRTIEVPWRAGAGPVDLAGALQ
jgi:hypothetical protein